MNKQYQKINEMLIAGLKSKGLKWFKPWKNASGAIEIPVNHATGNAYKGMNIFFLNAVQATKGYEHNEWCTYKQANDCGGQVIKGEKSTEVYLWKISFYDATATPKTFYRTEKEAIDAGIKKSNIRKAFTLRSYRVFNIAQCGLDAKFATKPTAVPVEVTPSEACENAQNAIEAWENCPEILQVGNQACYSPVADHVKMPKVNTFVDCDSYYKTLFHELAHSTGHKDRLNRDLATGFGTDKYAKEELVAEIASAYLAGYFQLDPKDGLDNTQAYVNGWIKKIENSKGNEEGFAVSAMSQALKATEMILSGVNVLQAV